MIHPLTKFHRKPGLKVKRSLDPLMELRWSNWYAYLGAARHLRLLQRLVREANAGNYASARFE